MPATFDGFAPDSSAFDLAAPLAASAPAPSGPSPVVVDPFDFLLLDGSAAGPGGGTVVAGPPPVVISASDYLLLDSGGEVLPADFPAAVFRALMESPDLLAALGAGPLGNTPRKVWYKLAPQRLAPPWLVFNVASVPNIRPSAGHYLASGSIDVVAYAPTRPAAGAVADLARRLLLTAMDDEAIRWDGATLLDLLPEDGSSPLPPSHGPGVGRLYQEVRSLQYVYEEDDA